MVRGKRDSSLRRYKRPAGFFWNDEGGSAESPGCRLLDCRRARAEARTQAEACATASQLTALLHHRQERVFALLVVAALFGALLVGAGLPTVRYFRILSSLFGSMPLMAWRSSTLFERAVSFARLQDFLRGGRPDARHQLQFLGSSGIQIDEVRRRLFLCAKILRHPGHKDQGQTKKKAPRIPALRP
jgi:hypothetical protein